ncbi:MAG: hypothetical protein RQ936_03650 [Gammaproteobacteria bacterium]|nr:hypothetical protein [Gammaproteobacteria bacterium]
MSKLLSQWTPSQAAIDVIKLNGFDDAHIAKSEEYLKNQTDLEDIDKLEGYDSWDSLFIVFCIKAGSGSAKSD